MGEVEEWWSGGQRVELALGSATRTIFLRREGSGPVLTLLHGFPSSSHDWARVAPALRARFTLLSFDFLGFGASEKPPEHDYSIAEQTDLVEAIWDREGVSSSMLLAHDYAVSVTQELLARRGQGALAVDLVGAHLLNGGLYTDAYQPLPGQMALLDREQGPAISAQLSEELWIIALKPTFAEDFDATADCAQMWRAMSREDGHLITHRLIRYIEDRAVHGERWAAALESTDVPLSFTWGMLDPISGARMAERIRERLPRAPFQALEDVAHWPALEAPERVAAAVLSAD